MTPSFQAYGLLRHDRGRVGPALVAASGEICLIHDVSGIPGVRAQPQQAKGLDSALRALAATPLGPWLLLVAPAGGGPSD